MPGRAQHRGHGPSSGEDEDVQDVDLGDAGPSLVDVLLHKAEPPRQATRYAHSAPKAPTAFQRPGGDDARPAQPPRQTAEERQAAFGSFSVGFGASRTKVTPKVTALASNTSNVSHYFAADTGKAPEDTRRRPSSVKLTPSRRPKSSADLMRPPPEKMTIETIDSGSETGDTPTESAKEERPPGPDQSNEHAINLMCLDFLYYEFVSTLLKEWESTEKLHWVREKLDKLARAPPGTETDEWLDDSGFDTDERVYSMDAETRAQIARHDDTQLRRDLRRETLEKREKVLEAKATKCFHRVDKINAIIESWFRTSFPYYSTF